MQCNIVGIEQVVNKLMRLIKKTILIFMFVAFAGIGPLLPYTNGTLITAQADEVSDLKATVQEFKDIEQSVKALQEEYITAVRIESELTAQITILEKELEENKKEIAEHQELFEKVTVAEYKRSPATLLLGILFNSKTLVEVRQAGEYASYILNYESRVIDELEELKAEREMKTLEVNEKKTSLENEKLHLDFLRTQLENNKKELEPKIEFLRQSLASVSASLSDTEQLENILAYLNSMSELTETQEAIVRSAYSTPYAGGNLCEAWAEEVYRNAGVDVPLLSSAIAGKDEYFVSDSTENIPPGAWVYGSGVGYMGSLYGHVGIYVGNGLIMDNEGSRTKQAVPIEQWVSWQTASQNGKSGWYGWGYPGGLDFNPEM